MPTAHYPALLAVILVLQSYVVTAAPPPDNVPPVFDVCQEASVCGRGKCVHVSNNTIGFECECEPGWRQDRPEEDVFLKFLPCVVPKCMRNLTCADTSHPRDDENYRKRSNSTNRDPCTVADCGGGRCNATSPFTRTCECEEGYYNLLNSPVFPCYRQCAFGEDCPSLGYNSTTSIMDPNPLSSRYNHAASLMKRAELACFITMATMFVAAAWKCI